MRRAQTVILGLGLSVVALMSLFPPWERTSWIKPGYYGGPAGYHFVFVAPEENSGWVHRLDLDRLMLQVAAVVSTVGVAWVIEAASRKVSAHK